MDDTSGVGCAGKLLRTLETMVISSDQPKKRHGVTLIATLTVIVSIGSAAATIAFISTHHGMSYYLPALLLFIVSVALLTFHSFYKRRVEFDTAIILTELVATCFALGITTWAKVLDEVFLVLFYPVLLLGVLAGLKTKPLMFVLFLVFVLELLRALRRSLLTLPEFSDSIPLDVVIVFLVVASIVIGPSCLVLNHIVSLIVAREELHTGFAITIEHFAVSVANYDLQTAEDILQAAAPHLTRDLRRHLSAIIHQLEQYHSFFPQVLAAEATPGLDFGPITAVTAPLPANCSQQGRQHDASSSPTAVVETTAVVMVGGAGDDMALVDVDATDESDCGWEATAGSAPPSADELRDDRNSVASSLGQQSQSTNAPVAGRMQSALFPPLSNTSTTVFALDAGIQKSQVAVALIALEHMVGAGDGSLCLSSAYNDALTTIANLASAHGGVLHSVSGVIVRVAWGLGCGAQQARPHQLCQFALALRLSFSLARGDKIEQLQRRGVGRTAPRVATEALTVLDALDLANGRCGVSCAIATGDGFHGMAGSDLQKYPCLLGPYAPDFTEDTGGYMPTDLELLFECARLHNAIVVSSEVMNAISNSFLFRPIDAARWSGSNYDASTTAQGSEPRCASVSLDDAGALNSVNSQSGFACTAQQSSVSSFGVTPRGASMLMLATRISKLVVAYEIVSPVVAAIREDLGDEWIYSGVHCGAATGSPVMVCEAMSEAMESMLRGDLDAGLARLAILRQKYQCADFRVSELEAQGHACRRADASYHRNFGWSV